MTEVAQLAADDDDVVPHIGMHRGGKDLRLIRPMQHDESHYVEETIDGQAD